eukprot:1096624-Prymnesium_polylepis.1
MKSRVRLSTCSPACQLSTWQRCSMATLHWCVSLPTLPAPAPRVTRKRCAPAPQGTLLAQGACAVRPVPQVVRDS